jgi:hypothetical protein
MLLVSPCAQLKSLSALLREKYDERNKTIARGYADTSLLKAELETIRVQKIITRHRRLCPHCKLNENSAVAAGARFKPLRSERSVGPIRTC